MYRLTTIAGTGFLVDKWRDTWRGNGIEMTSWNNIAYAWDDDELLSNSSAKSRYEPPARMRSLRASFTSPDMNPPVLLSWHFRYIHWIHTYWSASTLYLSYHHLLISVEVPFWRIGLLVLLREKFTYTRIIPQILPLPPAPPISVLQNSVLPS